MSAPSHPSKKQTNAWTTVSAAAENNVLSEIMKLDRPNGTIVEIYGSGMFVKYTLYG